MSDDVSVVIPAYNESESLDTLFSALRAFVQTISYRIQFVFVDDGSTDDTCDQILAAKVPNASIKLVRLSRNFGAHDAIRAGIFAADAEKIIFYSADMPEPVEDIDLFYSKLCEGYELVYSERIGYKGSLGSGIYAKLVKSLIRIDYPQNGLIGVALGGKIKRQLNLNIEASSSIFFQLFSLGFKRIGIPVPYLERKHGSSKWTLRKKIRHFLDVFVMFSYVPIHAISLLGIALFAIGIIWAFVILIFKLLAPDELAAGWPTTISILLIGFGVTNLSLGIIAEYLARTLVASRNRPVFIISDIYDDGVLSEDS
jgi:dolichol-phosphate mannosyltransferase